MKWMAIKSINHSGLPPAFCSENPLDMSCKTRKSFQMYFHYIHVSLILQLFIDTTI